MGDETMTIEDRRRMGLAAARNGGVPGPKNSESATKGNRPKESPAGRQSRIGLAEAMLMIGVSLLFDGAQALLGLLVIGIVLNSAISVVAWLTFFLWFHAKGMSYGVGLKGGLSTAKNPMVINAAAFLIGLIPILNILPERTVAIVAIIALERAERFTKAGVMRKMLEPLNAPSASLKKT